LQQKGDRCPRTTTTAAAVKSEQCAIGQAQKLEWDLAPLNERLARYQSGQPWTGYLLTF